MRLTRPAICVAAAILLASCSVVGYEGYGLASREPARAGPASDGAPEIGDGGEGRPRAGRFTPQPSDLPPGEDAAIVAARRLATEEELRPPAPVLLARPDGPELKELPLEALRVATVLTATRARTLVDCVFRNPYGATLQGTLAVRLPEGASPARLGMFQGIGTYAGPSLCAALLPPRLDSPEALLGAEPVLPASWDAGAVPVRWDALRPARVVAQEQGKAVYESVTRRRVDPALLEWSGGDAFRARIFPIAAQARKRVFFVYDQPPLEVAGRAAIPLAVPRAPPPAFRLEVAADARAWRDARLLCGRDDRPLAAPASGWASASLEGASAPPAAAVLLSAAPASPVQAGFASSGGVLGTLVHARLRPEVAAREGERTRDAVFLVDTSLSGRTRLAASFGRLLREVLERDATIERFRVFAFDVTAREVTRGPTRNGPAERDRILGLVEAIPLEGATSIEAALEAAEGAIDPGARPPVFFLLSDAQATWGMDAPRDLERRFPRALEARWICYRVGDAAVGRGLMEALVRSGGRVVDVPSAADLRAAAVAHRSLPLALGAPSVEGGTASDLVVQGTPRALHPGQTLEVAFRLAPGEDPRRASVVLHTEDGALRFPLSSAVEGDEPAARAWAELTAEALLALETKDADRQALALSQRFGIVNRVASMLILETDAEYAQWQIAEAPLDLVAAARAAAGRYAALPAGAPDDSALDKAAWDFLSSIEGARLDPARAAWAKRRDPVSSGEGTIPERPRWGERVDPVAAWRAAGAFRASAAAPAGEALRILTSIVEEAPRDAQALRLVGFTLLEWRRYDEAAALFARARRQRPFEPQALLCEAFALEAAGRPAEAALRLEVVLAGSFDRRWEAYAKEAARRQYARLLRSLAAPHAAAALARLDALGLPGETPRFEVALYWSIDDADVDMHVVPGRGNPSPTPPAEGSVLPGDFGSEISYRSRKKGGAELLWDNTAGLGPEVFVDRARVPSRVYVRYFGTRATEGRVPAATLVVVRAGAALQARASVLADASEEVVLWEAADGGERVE